MASIHFTTIIRLPFARGDFVDPPQADWNATKDRALWKVISKSSKTSDLNWVELATRFQVPPTFILQQAAWLYERHFEHVRSQMKKVGGASAPSAASGVGGSQSAVGGIPMQRLGSASSRASRTPSTLSIRPRDSPIPRADSITSATAPPPPALSRTPSTNTITQSRAYAQPAAIRTQPTRPARPSLASPKSTAPAFSVDHSQTDSTGFGSPSVAASSSSSSSSESDLDNPVHRSQLFKRPPRFQKQRPRELPTYDEGAEEEGDIEQSGEVILPFAHGLKDGQSDADDARSRNPNAAPNEQSRQTKSFGKQRVAPDSRGLDASSSLASSASDAPRPSTGGPGPLSPRHRAELARLSPRGKGRKDGSEGTPSMGSSFSDIDDAGISQSALEEALLSDMRTGKMSTLSSLRSRYL
ncbi:hypothetical protein B0J11DRAFT_288929 [Dendryphion nanum]|uniref:Autophagy-related protein 29 n=1 Tax=Dendryphion nanum TaxID=256645 RepID=A0A9P9IPU4_9PLEO|nr:hypothetical protein B0J11DRAFT_288929 [Dendryphion nanum]